MKRQQSLAVLCSLATRQGRTGARQASSSSSAAGGNDKSTGFSASLKFKLAPGQVDETNVPSARDVSRMLPSVKDLHAQLPGAHELEKRYINQDSVVNKTGAAEAPAAAAAATDGAPGIFIAATDPLEDFLDGKEAKTEMNPQHVLLAYKALGWGTVYAVAGFSIVVALCMAACGYRSLRELAQGVRDKVSRDEARLHADAERRAEADGGTVVHYKIDLSDPTEAYRQMREIWDTVQDIAEDEAAKGQKSA